MSIGDNLQKLLNEEKVKKEKVNENFKPKIPRKASDIIDELRLENFGSGKKLQREASQRFLELANSDDPISNAYFRKIDSAATTIGEQVMKKFNVEVKKEEVKPENDEDASEENDEEKKKNEDIKNDFENSNQTIVDDAEIKSEEGLLGLNKYFKFK